MAVPSSGQLRLRADINQEVNGNDTDDNVSLGTLADDAGFDTPPDTMQEFYGYSANVTINWNAGGLGNTTVTNNNLTNGTYTPEGSVSGQYYELQVNSGYGFQSWNSVSVSNLPSGMTYSVSNAGGTTYGLGVGKVRITFGGIYPATSQTISPSVTAIRTVTATMGTNPGWPSQTGVYYGYNQNCSGFGSVVQGGTYRTPTNNSSKSIKVWNGQSTVTLFQFECAMGEYWANATGSASTNTSGWTMTSQRDGSQYLHNLVATRSGGITSNQSVNVTQWSSGGNTSNYGTETGSQINRGSGGGNWSCSNVNNQYISNTGWTSGGGSNLDPRRKVYGFGYTPHTNQNWAYGPYSFSTYSFSWSVASGGTVNLGTGATANMTVLNGGVNGCST